MSKVDFRAILDASPVPDEASKQQLRDAMGALRNQLDLAYRDGRVDPEEEETLFRLVALLGLPCARILLS